MAIAALKRRELYVDMGKKEEVPEELFLYQVDFYTDGSFRNKEYLFRKEEAEEGQKTEEEQKLKEEQKTEEPPAEEPVAEEEPEDIMELFRAQWKELQDCAVPVEIFATDASLFRQEFTLDAGKKEQIHDIISMGRMMSVAAFDEEPYLSAGIRRRIKERYHGYAEEVRKKREEHLFLRRMPSGSTHDWEVSVTDREYRVQNVYQLPKTAKENSNAGKLAEIIAEHPDADLIADRYSSPLYQLLDAAAAENAVLPMLFSLESMFYAAGKTATLKHPAENYARYLKNLEEIRFGRFSSEKVLSEHTFFLPVAISGEKEWKKQFAENLLWKPVGKDAYRILADGEKIKGKYSIRAGREQFVLRLESVTIKKYPGSFALLAIKVKNCAYPGETDKERIHALASNLFLEGEGADSLELKLKLPKKTYLLSAVKREGNQGELWLNGLLIPGRRKKLRKHPLVLRALCEKMYCMETVREAQEELVSAVLMRDGMLKETERKLAECAAPKTPGKFSGLTRKQKKQMRALYEQYRYLMVSFGSGYQTEQREERELWKVTEQKTEVKETAERLKEKFQFYFS